MKYFIGLDLGTQSSKGLLMAPDGSVVAQASSDYLPDFPRPGWAEDDAEVWVRAFGSIIAQLKESSGVSAADIGTICFASQCGGVVPIDKNGRALAKSINWMDCRCIPQYEALSSKIGYDEVLRIVGCGLSSDIVLAKMLWFCDNMPDVYEKAAAFVEPGEFMVARLTGNIVGDYCHASVSSLYDVVKREWSERMLEVSGYDRGKLYPIRAAADIAGTVLPDVARELGLDPATQVCVGTGDAHAALIGCGLVKPGMTLDIAGTSEVVAAITDKLAFDDTGVIWTHLFPDPRYYDMEQSGIVSGGCVRWFRDTVARCGFDEMEVGAYDIPAGCDGLLFLPYLQGAVTPRADSNARGVFFGLSMNHTLAHLTRAVYEGVSFAFRDCVEHLDEMGIAGDLIVAGGGGTKSPLWCQMKADMSGKALQVVESANPTALGAAMIAGHAQGCFDSFEQAAEKLVSRGKIYEPNPALKPAYDEAYAFYQQCAADFSKDFGRYAQE